MINDDAPSTEELVLMLAEDIYARVAAQRVAHVSEGLRDDARVVAEEALMAAKVFYEVVEEENS